MIDMHSIDGVPGITVLYLNQVNYLDEAAPDSKPVHEHEAYRAELVYYREVPYNNLPNEAT